MKPLLLSAYTATSCIGRGLDATLAALRSHASGLAPCTFETVDLVTYVGEVAGVDAVMMREDLIAYDCRNNRLAQLGIEQDGFVEAVRTAVGRYGRNRIAVLIGTSTAGILQTELAYRRRDRETGALPRDFLYAQTHNTFSVADFVRRYLDLNGPATAVSSACSSSAKVFASARRMIEAGIVDAAVVGGVDSLCLTTLYGFNSLELTSSTPCRPYDRDRNGLSIGEAAGFALLERTPADAAADAILLLGAGESSDAHHMSAPRPDGLGARMAMEGALSSAGALAADIDYINLHGTATPSNDAAEGNAVAALFGTAVACSSTKGATGHTLGAAGGLEAVITALALREGFIPGGVNTEHFDPAIPISYVTENRPAAVQRALSNSFGFGGTNCSLLFGRAH
ncbi:MAG: beta-ketoacyl-[acyl-carrier-protein] synthase family protein [Casimicrobiaceae bacterium]